MSSPPNPPPVSPKPVLGLKPKLPTATPPPIPTTVPKIPPRVPNGEAGPVSPPPIPLNRAGTMSSIPSGNNFAPPANGLSALLRQSTSVTLRPVASRDPPALSSSSSQQLPPPVAKNEEPTPVTIPLSSSSTMPPAIPEPVVEEILTPEQEAQRKAEKRERIRNSVAAEIASTEETYVTAMETFDQLFYKPLEEAGSDPEKAIVSISDLFMLFGQIRIILNLNRKFLEDLKRRLVGWKEDTCISDLFIQFAHFFKMYIDYVNNYGKITDFLSKLDKSDTKWQNFIKALSMDPRNKGNSLTSYLIQPIQRVPRYNLLLNELIKNTNETHPDYEGLKKALELVSSVATNINSAVKLREAQQLVIAAKESLLNIPEEWKKKHGDLVSPHRRLVRQGPLTKICRSSDKLYEFFLFSDLLIYADKQVTGKFKVHKLIDFTDHNFSIQDIPNSGEESKHQFRFLSKEKSFIVYADSLQTKIDWLKDANEALSSLREGRKNLKVENSGATDFVAPVWAHDTSSKNCSICQTGFTWTNRRHHCRLCGALVCGDCSKKRMKMTKRPNDPPQRICDVCADNVTKQQDKNSAASPGEITDEIPEGRSVAPSFNMMNFPAAARPNVIKCKTIYAYEKAAEGDLSFPVGVEINLLERNDNGWWFGEYNGQKGVFPMNYVSIISENGSPISSNQTVDLWVKAIAGNTAQDERGLTFAFGDTLHVTMKDGIGNYFGNIHGSQAIGWFSSNLVQETSDPDSSDSETSTSSTPSEASLPPSVPVTKPPSPSTVLSKLKLGFPAAATSQSSSSTAEPKQPPAIPSSVSAEPKQPSAIPSSMPVEPKQPPAIPSSVLKPLPTSEPPKQPPFSAANLKPASDSKQPPVPPSSSLKPALSSSSTEPIKSAPVFPVKASPPVTSSATTSSSSSTPQASPSPAVASSTPSGKPGPCSDSGCECKSFEPHKFKKNQCLHCFHPIASHCS